MDHKADRLDAAQEEVRTLRWRLSQTEEERDKYKRERDEYRDLIECFLYNDPYEQIADNGAVILDQWRYDARRAMGLIKVTRWQHPDIDYDFVLEGGIEETEPLARQHFEENPELLSGRLDYVTREELNNMREFEG
jgi:hypothetical protein